MANVGVVDQSGRTVVRRAYPKATTLRRASATDSHVELKFAEHDDVKCTS